MLGTVPPTNTYEPPISAKESAFDWSKRMSIDMVRRHTKTDDTPAVDDEQLNLYRDASIESAERYTGLLLAGQKMVTEPIQGPAHLRAGKWTYKYTLRYPVADGLVYMYGSFRHTFHVPIGTRTIQVPIKTGYIDLSNCCDPHACHHMNNGMMAAYMAGFSCPDEVPAGIVVGCLQYIAWILEHPGDELMGLRNKIEGRQTGVGGILGTNNIAVASGALEQWRIFDNEAI